MYGPLTSQTPWTTTPTPWPTTQPPRRRRHRDHERPCHEDDEWDRHYHHERGCRHCGRDACECYCCIGDVDVVVYTRVGELRIVPIRVENERRREREIKVELSAFTTRGGKEGLVQAAVRPQELTLAPCGEQELVLAFHVGELKGDQGKGGEKTDLHVRAVEAVEQRHLADVDSCEVVTADLRLVGCDHRSVRIAAAVLPRDCDPFRVSCGCTCC
jgi:hypothetical protein